MLSEFLGVWHGRSKIKMTKSFDIVTLFYTIPPLSIFEA
jgi:hypothetical protein